MSLLPSRPDAEPAEDAGPRVIGVEDEAADDVLAALSSGTARSLLSALHDDPAPPSELAERCDTSLQNVQYHLGKLEGAGAVEVVDTAYSAKGREMDVYAPADQPLVVFAGREEDGSTLRTALKRLLGAIGVLALGSLLIQSVYGDLPFGPLGAGDRAPSGGGGGGGGDGGGGFDGDAEPDVDGAPPPDGESADAGDVTTQGETPTPTETPADTATATDGGATATAEPEATQTATETALETPQPTPEPTPTEVARDTATEVATTVTDGAQPAAEAAAGGLPPGLVFFAGGLFVLGVLGVVWYVSREWERQ